MIQNINIARFPHNSRVAERVTHARRRPKGPWRPRMSGISPDRGKRKRERRWKEEDASRPAVCVCLCAFKGSRTTALGAAHCGLRIATEDAEFTVEKSPLAFFLPSISLSLSSVPLCPDITRQKYCDWSTIEYDVTWLDRQAPAMTMGV